MVVMAEKQLCGQKQNQVYKNHLKLLSDSCKGDVDLTT